MPISSAALPPDVCVGTNCHSLTTGEVVTLLHWVRTQRVPLSMTLILYWSQDRSLELMFLLLASTGTVLATIAQTISWLPAPVSCRTYTQLSSRDRKLRDGSGKTDTLAVGKSSSVQESPVQSRWKKQGAKTPPEMPWTSTLVHCEENRTEGVLVQFRRAEVENSSSREAVPVLSRKAQTDAAVDEVSETNTLPLQAATLAAGERVRPEQKDSNCPELLLYLTTELAVTPQSIFKSAETMPEDPATSWQAAPFRAQQLVPALIFLQSLLTAHALADSPKAVRSQVFETDAVLFDAYQQRTQELLPVFLTNPQASEVARISQFPVHWNSSIWTWLGLCSFSRQEVQLVLPPATFRKSHWNRLGLCAWQVFVGKEKERQSLRTGGITRMVEARLPKENSQMLQPGLEASPLQYRSRSTSSYASESSMRVIRQSVVTSAEGSWRQRRGMTVSPMNWKVDSPAVVETLLTPLAFRTTRQQSPRKKLLRVREGTLATALSQEASFWKLMRVAVPASQLTLQMKSEGAELETFRRQASCSLVSSGEVWTSTRSEGWLKAATFHWFCTEVPEEVSTHTVCVTSKVELAAAVAEPPHTTTRSQEEKSEQESQLPSDWTAAKVFETAEQRKREWLAMRQQRSEDVATTLLLVSVKVWPTEQTFEERRIRSQQSPTSTEPI